MPSEGFKPRGSTKSSKPNAGNTNIYTAPVFGVVKDNIDPTKSGRLRVYITDICGMDPDDADNWVTVGFMTNFFGAVRPTSNDTGYGKFKENSVSYGEWHSPPDIGTTVVCLFINGDPNYGFYIGCIPEPETLHMVPAIGSSTSSNKQTESVVFNNQDEAESYGGSIRLPLCNMNTNNDGLTQSATFATSPKPIHSYNAAIMEQQGVIRDPIRGPISSSATRESASRVGWGVSTPGRPIYEGGYTDAEIGAELESQNAERLRVISRRGGHSIVMDDGDISGRDQLVRIRTSLGHQILMSDDGQTLMILHSNGQSYVELGKEGTVDVYSTNSVNVRTQGDLNLHADNNINIHAAKEFNIHAENMNVTTEKSLKQSVGSDLQTSAVGSISARSQKTISYFAQASASLESVGATYLNGSTINLNSGSGPSTPVKVEPLPVIMHTDTLFDETKGFTAAPGTLKSITSRAPAHAPWANAGQGVDVSTDLTATAKLPKQTNEKISNLVQSSLNQGPIPAATSTIVSAPNVNTISQALYTAPTSALLGAAARRSSTGWYRNGIKYGSTVLSDSTGRREASLGSFTQTPEQLAGAGVLKPGSDRRIAGLVSSGANISHAMPDSVFTGQYGAHSLASFNSSSETQSSTVVARFKTSQNILTTSGIITGDEAPSQISGVVFSAAMGSPAATINTIQNSTSTNGPTSSITNDVGLATASVVHAENKIGGSAGLSQSVQALYASPLLSSPPDTTKGVTGAAFDAIAGSFPNFTTGVPINLVNTEAAQTLTTDNISFSRSSADLASFTNFSTNKESLLWSTYTGGSLFESTNIASGINNLPGGAYSTSSIVDGDWGTVLLTGSQYGYMAEYAYASAMNNQSIPNYLGISNISDELSFDSPYTSASILTTISATKSLYGGKGSSRPPTIGLNTNNRTEIDEKTTKLLGDPKIPAPIFTGENYTYAVDTLLDRELTQNEISRTTDQLTALNRQIQQLRNTEGAQVLQAERQALPGDPTVTQKRSVFQTKLNGLLAQRDSLQTKINTLRNNIS